MTSNPITLRTVGTGILVVGVIVILIAALQGYGQYNVLRSWTPLPAQFVRTDVRNEKINLTIQTSRADRYIVTWTFRFNVGGVWHEATTAPGTHGTYSQMIAWTRRFHPGQQVLIRYDPSNPDEISAAAYDWITFSRAAWVAAWGIGIILVGFVLRRSANPAVASGGP